MGETPVEKDFPFSLVSLKNGSPEEVKEFISEIALMAGYLEGVYSKNYNTKIDMLSDLAEISTMMMKVQDKYDGPSRLNIYLVSVFGAMCPQITDWNSVYDRVRLTNPDAPSKKNLPEFIFPTDMFEERHE